MHFSLLANWKLVSGFSSKIFLNRDEGKWLRCAIPSKMILWQLENFKQCFLINDWIELWFNQIKRLCIKLISLRSWKFIEAVLTAKSQVHRALY